VRKNGIRSCGFRSREIFSGWRKARIRMSGSEPRKSLKRGRLAAAALAISVLGNAQPRSGG
jgi:hypothetical protein